MFRGIHPVFWVGLAIIYGLTFMFMIIEMTTPGFTYNVKIGGAPAIMFYLCIFMNLIVNIFVAWMWYYFPERDSKRKAGQSAGGNGVSTSGS